MEESQKPGEAGARKSELRRQKTLSTPKRDKRVQRTEKAIRTAFFRLLERMDYEKITVSALAREAGIDRKTFYLHYGSIDALTDEMLRESSKVLVDSLISGLQARMSGSPKEPQRTEPLRMGPLFSAFCDQMDGGMPNLRSQMRHIPVDMLLDRMPDVLAEAFVEDGRLVHNVPKPFEELCAAFVGAGMTMLFRRWVLEVGDKPSAEEVAKLADTLVFDGLHGVVAFAGAKVVG